jgi:hypothetical protein
VAEPHRPGPRPVEPLAAPPGVGGAVHVVEAEQRGGERFKRLRMLGAAPENGARVPGSQRVLARAEALAGDREEALVAEHRAAKCVEHRLHRTRAAGSYRAAAGPARGCFAGGIGGWQNPFASRKCSGCEQRVTRRNA